MPIPPGVVGHDPSYRSINQYDPVLANKLLDYFGYKKGTDGYRTLPDGKPLTIRQATGTAAIDREFSELWKKSMDAIGIRMEFEPGKFADTLKAAKACQLMMWQASWTRRLSGRRQLHAAPLRPEHRRRATTAATNRRRSTRSTRSR